MLCVAHTWLNVNVQRSVFFPAINWCQHVFVCHYRETNLKVKQALPDTATLGGDVEKFKAFDGKYINLGFVPRHTYQDDGSSVAQFIIHWTADPYVESQSYLCLWDALSDCCISLSEITVGPYVSTHSFTHSLIFGLMGRAWDYLPMSMVCLYPGRRRFMPRLWLCSTRTFSSHQATGKVFSTEHAIYSKF